MMKCFEFISFLKQSVLNKDLTFYVLVHLLKVIISVAVAGYNG